MGMLAEENSYGTDLVAERVPFKEGYVRYVLTVAQATVVTHRDAVPLVQHWDSPRHGHEDWRAHDFREVR